jgi:ribulose-phosphate 3-epimerase
MKKIKIQPSLLACNMAEMQKEIDKVDPFVDGIHFDVMDGQFVPNLTFGAPVLSKLKTKTQMGFDVHLMCEKPEILLNDFVKAGASAISVHFETCNHINKTLQDINNLGIKSGVALNPATSYESSYEAIKKADFVLVMSVNPGFGGQKFLPEILDKIKKIRKNFPNKDIQVDGGITSKTAPLVIEAGANNLVSGSYIFNSNNIEEASKILKNES